MVETRPSSHAARLLKTLVVAGASLGLTGCGGESRRTQDEGRGGDAGSGGTSNAGGLGATGGVAGGGGAGGTRNIEDCAGAQRVCACTYQPPVNVTCTVAHPLGYLTGVTNYEVTSMDCRCDPDRPAVPEDCEFTEQFTCVEYAPEYEQCLCDPDAPRTESDCKGRGSFICVGSEPRLGCHCLARIG